MNLSLGLLALLVSVDSIDVDAEFQAAMRRMGMLGKKADEIRLGRQNLIETTKTSLKKLRAVEKKDNADMKQIADNGVRELDSVIGKLRKVVGDN